MKVSGKIKLASNEGGKKQKLQYGVCPLIEGDSAHLSLPPRFPENSLTGEEHKKK